ncbi:MAG: hypothetical protein NXI24_22900 [bacterium]|nr:hypothetical protein [bacterium]
MDTDLFLERCEAVENGLHALKNEFFHSLDEGPPDADRSDLIARAREKIRLFEELVADIADPQEDPEEEEEIQTFYRYINSLKEYVARAEFAS